MKNTNWKQIFEGEYLDIWQTPKGKDGKSDFVLAVGGTHLFLNANTVFPELKIATDTVSREMFRTKRGVLPMSKALQVYDKIEEKVVDIPEDEVESVQNTRRIYFGIQQKVFEASTVGTVANISVRSFITGLLRYGKWQVEKGLKQNPEHLMNFPKGFGKPQQNKIIDMAEEITNSEDDRAAIARFKKPYKQLSDAEKETLEEDLDDQYTLDAITYCLICRALDLWTPKFWRLDAVAAKIAEVEKVEYEKEKGHSRKRESQG